MCIFTKVFKVDKKHLQYSSTRAKIGSMKQAFKTAGAKKLPPSGFSRLSVLYYTPLQQGKECFPKETLFVLFCHTFPLPCIPITREPLGKEDKLWGGFGFCWGFGPGAPWGCWPRRWSRPGGCGNGSSSWRNCPIHGTSRQRCGGAPLFFVRFPLPGFHGIMIAKENHSGSSLSLTYEGAMPQFYEPGKKTENYKPDSPWPSPLGSMAKPCLGAEPSEAGRENFPPIPITSQNKSSIPSNTKNSSRLPGPETPFPPRSLCWRTL